MKVAYRLMIFSLLCALIASPYSYAQSQPDGKKLNASQKIMLDRAVEGLRKVADKKKLATSQYAAKYLANLDRIADQLAEQGDLQALVLLRKEAQTVKAGAAASLFEEGDDKLPKAIATARAAFKADLVGLEKKAAALEEKERLKAIENLKALQLAWTKDRKIEAALFAKHQADELSKGANPLPVKPSPANPSPANPGGVTEIAKPTTPTKIGDGEQKPGDRMQITLGGEITMSFRWCPPGTFMMGSPEGEEGRATALLKFPDTNEDQREVQISEGFWIAETEVTQEQWFSLMTKGSMKTGLEKTPITPVKWDDSIVFCEKLTQRLHESDAKLNIWKASLPAETQWEYACRAGTITALSNGLNLTSMRDSRSLDKIAWYKFNKTATPAGFESDIQCKPVGLLAANPWGIHGMHGNASEWCLDDYPSKEEAAKAAKKMKAVRGGSTTGYAFGCRSASRRGSVMTGLGGQLSFRPVLVLSSYLPAQSASPVE